MFRYVTLCGIVFFIPAVLVFAHAGHEHGTFYVQMGESGFTPSAIEIQQGDTVIFENNGTEDHWPASNVHPTHTDYSGLDPKRPLSPGGSWGFTFDKTGTWGIHDHLFPYFTGSITVLESGQTGTGDVKSGPGFWERIAGLWSRLIGGIAAIFANDEVAEETTDVSASDVQFRSPEPYVIGELYTGLSFECTSTDHGCISNVLKDIVGIYGPEAALDIFGMLVGDGRVARSVNDHQLAHEVGRETARVYGLNSNAFLLCPMSSYNGGCQHGFFEYVLGKTETTVEAADLICASLGDEYSSKFRFYCYHGVGHGVMMAEAYDLRGSLDICDSFTSDMAKNGCYQGVFMENANAGMGGYAREGVFSQDDPLAPCDTLNAVYKHECYINHAGYLVQFYRRDVGQATKACLDVEEGWISTCMQSIGLMVTNPSWQVTLLLGAQDITPEEKAWEICKLFPEGWKNECVIGGIDNIMNFDEFDTTRAKTFCSTVDEEFRAGCFREMGVDLRNQSTSREEVYNACTSLGATLDELCLEGAHYE